MNLANKRQIKKRQTDVTADSRECLNLTNSELNYEKPMLFVYGDVRDVTLGGSPGGGDSGTPTTRRRR